MILALSVILAFLGRYLIETQISRAGGGAVLFLAMALPLWRIGVRARASISGYPAWERVAALALLGFTWIIAYDAYQLGTSGIGSVLQLVALPGVWLLYMATGAGRAIRLPKGGTLSPVAVALVGLSLVAVVLQRLGAPTVIESLQGTGDVFVDKERMALPIIYGVVPGSVIAGLGACGFAPLLLSGPMRTRLVACLAVLAAVYVVFLTGTRGALMAVAATVVWGYAPIRRAAAQRPGLWAGAVIAVAILLPFIYPKVYRVLESSWLDLATDRFRRETEESVFSFSRRHEMWDIASDALWSPRVLSGQFRAFGEDEAMISGALAAVQGIWEEDRVRSMHSHNTGLNMMYSGGLLMLGCYVACGWAALRRVLRGAEHHALGTSGILLGWFMISGIESLFNGMHTFFPLIFFGLLAECLLPVGAAARSAPQPEPARTGGIVPAAGAGRPLRPGSDPDLPKPLTQPS